MDNPPSLTLVEPPPLKRCSKCGLEKPLSDFNLKTAGKYHADCKQCKSDYHKHYYQTNGVGIRKRVRQTKERKKDHVRHRKESEACVDCGIAFPYYVMDLDHLNGDEKVDHVSRLCADNVALVYILDELKKCDVVCANCHRIRTFARLGSDLAYLDTKQRQEIYYYVKGLKEAPCTDCGNTFPSCAMDFDHVRGSKKFKISDMYTYSKAQIDKELKKCELVCANCHRARTHSRKQYGKRKRRK